MIDRCRTGAGQVPQTGAEKKLRKKVFFISFFKLYQSEGRKLSNALGGGEDEADRLRERETETDRETDRQIEEREEWCKRESVRAKRIEKEKS